MSITIDGYLIYLLSTLYISGKMIYSYYRLIGTQSEQNKMKTIYLVACAATKENRKTKAKDIYVSEWFKKARRDAEQNADEWFIISAKHGVLNPEKEITPYNEMLNGKSYTKRRNWFMNCLDQLFFENEINLLDTSSVKFVILAGSKYFELFADCLPMLGINYELPLEGKGIGQQLQALNQLGA